MLDVGAESLWEILKSIFERIKYSFLSKERKIEFNLSQLQKKYWFEQLVSESPSIVQLLKNDPELQTFPKNAVVRVETFEEFMVSNCELVLLVVDSIYVTIYCKNQETIELLNKNAITCAFEDIEYITDENDARTSLSVW